MSTTTTSFISDETLDRLTLAVHEYYTKEGYAGEFSHTAKFFIKKNEIILEAPDYTPYILFGRKPGKLPPIQPIISWCKQYGITASPWGIRYNIGRKGTKGNNFIKIKLNENNIVKLDKAFVSKKVDSVNETI